MVNESYKIDESTLISQRSFEGGICSDVSIGIEHKNYPKQKTEAGNNPPTTGYVVTLTLNAERLEKGIRLINEDEREVILPVNGQKFVASDEVFGKDIPSAIRTRYSSLITMVRDRGSKGLLGLRIGEICLDGERLVEVDKDNSH